MAALPNHDAHEAAERAARTAYGKLVAVLAARARDVHAAEDALSTAFAEALVAWPRDGVPDAPEAWLLTAARNNLTDLGRQTQRRREVDMADSNRIRSLLSSIEPLKDGADERLTMLFVCAHPAIEPAARTPLMLQAVLGLSAERIAAAFVTSPATMSQRLVRAKRRIASTGVRFATPEAGELPERLAHVLDAIYGAFGAAYDDMEGSHGSATTLAREALDLIAVVCEQLPDAPEAWGLRALMMLCHARLAARRDAHGAFVPLSAQDTTRWDMDLVHAGNQALHRAAAMGAPGRFQTEAAIHSAHMDGLLRGVQHADAIAHLYDVLVMQAPTIGNHVARAAAWGEAGRASDALVFLDALAANDVASHQPYWAVRADILRRLGMTREASACYQRAAGLTRDGSVRAWLLQRSGQGA